MLIPLLLLAASVSVKSVLGERCCGCPQGLPLPHPSSLGLEGEGWTQVPEFAAQAMAVDGSWRAYKIWAEASSSLPCLHGQLRAALPTLGSERKGETALATIWRGAELFKNQDVH